jgi:outer membrane protein assembly factor BamB
MIYVVGVLAAASFCELRPGAIGQIILQDPNRQRNSNPDGFSGVYLPTDRTVTRAMTRVRERLAEREYHQSLTFLQEVLQRDEDAFLDQTEDARQQLGLKATARQIVGQLPPEGLDTYELLHGAAARRQLDAALAAGDQDSLAAVVRQFFHTTAGYEAALVLAQMKSEQGHFLAAAQLYRELIAAPRAAAQLEPQLSVLAALNHLAANEAELAGTTLRALIEKQPSATVELLGKTEPLPAADDDLSKWLTLQIGQPLPTAHTETNWLSARGDATRNAERPGGRPHLRVRWEARVVNEPSVEAYLLGRSQELAERGIVTVPAARPIALDDLVVMRTPQNVVAIDWETGKRVWETRDDEEFESNEATTGPAGGIDDERFAIQGGPLEQRMWDDALVMSLASDGERVYVLRGDTVLTQDEFIAMQMAPNFNRRMPDMSAVTNRLAAYDVRTEGKLVWELDGARASGPLAGAFILGPPLAIDGTLYLMAEVRSAAYLIALDPATGHVRWQQQLVGLEQGILLDPARRRVGATPSYAGGILICPTAAGAVVAIDVVKREFAWVYRYRREMPSPGDFRAFQPQIRNQAQRSNDHWLDSSAIIAENRVFITPPESADLHCIDLATGKPQWTEQQGDALFVGCVDEGRILLVGPESVRALRVSDGTPAWEKNSAPLPFGALPAGHGYQSEGTYFLPLTSGEIAAIDMASGQVSQLEAGPQGQMLGNLICFHGSVLSQSAVALSKFEQLDALHERATAALARNPNDATALREIAELRQAEGQNQQAIDSLKRVLELAPQDPLARDMLADLLLAGLAADFAAHRGEIPLLSRLVRDRDGQLEMLRLEAEGLQQLGERAGAWGAYLQIADLTTEAPVYLDISRDYQARSDRWICGRLGRLWSEASAEEQAVFAAQLAERRSRLEDGATSAALRHYLSHFDLLPGASDVRRQLVEFLIEHKLSAEAQIELLEMSTAADRQERAVAATLMCKLLANSANPSAATPWRSLLAEEYHDTEVFDGLTGQEWLARRAAESSIPALLPATWPRGHVDVETTPSALRVRERSRGNRMPERQTGFRPLRIEQEFGPVASAIEWYIAADCSALVGREPLGDDVFHLALNQNSVARQYRNSDLVYGARLGDQLFVTMGSSLLAIDTRQNAADAEANLLWQAHPGGRFTVTMRGRRAARPAQFRANRRPVFHTLSSRKRTPGVGSTVVGSLGPVTPRGVLYQDDNELRCVDPLSGETLWSRSDLPAGCELFGDQEFVFAADVSEHQAYMLRIIDGQLVGKRDLPRSEWLLTAGRNLAQLGTRTVGDDRVLQLRITDIASQEKLFEAEYSAASATTVVEPNAVAMLEPSGKFQLIDVQSGLPIVDTQLEPISSLGSIEVIRSDESFFLLVGTKASRQRQQHRPVDQLDNQVTTGFVFAFNRNTGDQLWPGPAAIQHRGLVTQPDDLPFIVFLDRQTTSDGARGAKRRLRLLCLDKETGRTVYRNDDLPDTPVTRLRIRGEREGTPRVTIETNAGTIQLTLTDRPRPPRPPANDELEASRENTERGLVGLGQRMGAALRGTILQEGAPNARPVRPEAPEPIDDD